MEVKIKDVVGPRIPLLGIYLGKIIICGCLGLVQWDDPEGWNGEGGGRRVQDGRAFQVNNLPANGGDKRDAGLTPGSGRYPGEEHGNPLQHSCLENLMNRGGWRATVHSVPKSWT